MRLQNFFLNNPAVGASATQQVDLMPGQCGMLVMAVYTLTNALALSARIRLLESGIAQALCYCVNTEALAAGIQVITAASNARDSQASLAVQPGISLPLPKVILQQSFLVSLEGANLGGGDTIQNARILVLFGSLDELSQY